MIKRMKKIRCSAKRKAINHAPEIFMGIGIAGMVASTALAIKSTPRALEIIEEEQKELDEILEPIDKVKLTWKCYIPTLLVGGVSVICLIWGNRVSVKRYTALAAACSLSETAFREYRGRVIEKLGEQKEKEIHSEIAAERMKDNPVSQHKVIETGCGTDLCFDLLSGRYFYSDVQKLEKIVNELNRRMRDEMTISLNDYYWEINLDAIGIGDTLGWNIDTGYIELDYDTKLTKDNKPCIVVRHVNPPFYEYR